MRVATLQRKIRDSSQSKKKLVCVLTKYFSILQRGVPDMTARIIFRITVVALLVYSAVTQKCPASARSESSIFGWMHTCVFKCREDNRCQSFNWVISLLTCEFNNRTKEARPEDFIPNPERSYYPRDLKRGEPAY